jgi:hypothetical protein
VQKTGGTGSKTGADRGWHEKTSDKENRILREVAGNDFKAGLIAGFYRRNWKGTEAGCSKNSNGNLLLQDNTLFQKDFAKEKPFMPFIPLQNPLIGAALEHGRGRAKVSSNTNSNLP